MLRRAATCARFSTDLQRDASITDQQALCRRYAERNGVEIVRGYSDNAKSGARNGFCSSPEIKEIDHSLYAGGWLVAPQFRLCELKTAA